MLCRVTRICCGEILAATGLPARAIVCSLGRMESGRSCSMLSIALQSSSRVSKRASDARPARCEMLLWLSFRNTSLEEVASSCTPCKLFEAGAVIAFPKTADHLSSPAAHREPVSAGVQVLQHGQCWNSVQACQPIARNVQVQDAKQRLLLQVAV